MNTCCIFLFINIGHLHPVLVHLPIGILLFAFLLAFQDWRNKNNQFRKVIVLSLLTGMLSAVASCISGYILSRSGDYDAAAVNTHLWMGIATTIVTAILWWGYRGERSFRWLWPGMIGLFVMIIITGHVGGNLTHGAGYLLQSSGSSAGDAVVKVIPDVQEASVYADIVQPILEAKCYSCHNNNKKKGGLRLDEPGLIMKGGKDGVVVIPGKSDESSFMKRLLLPVSHEDHMPPKEKPQLTQQEVALMHWWIDGGASFDKKVKELEQPDPVRPALLALQQAPEIKAGPDIPETNISPAGNDAIQKLRDAGVVVLPVASNSNYLLANFVTTDQLNLETVKLLSGIKQQLTWLKIGDMPVNDSALAIIGQCKNLTRLQLNNTQITGGGLAELKDLQELRYLNLVGTAVTADAVRQLKVLKKLRNIYLYQTSVSGEDWPALQQAFPQVQLDSGGYKVPTLESDTTVLYFSPGK